MCTRIACPSTEESARVSTPFPRHSGRVRRDLSPNPLTAALAERRAAGAPVLDLTVSNPTHAALPYPEAEIRAALSEGAWMSYDPQPLGARPAREAVAGYYAERGIDVDPGRVVLTASTSEAYSYILKLLTEPGERWLVPRPSYPLFELLAAMESTVVDPYELRHAGEWSVDPGSVEAAIGPGTRALVLVHPNNPTGSFLRTEELAALARTCRRHGLALIGDEVFADYAIDGPAPSLLPGPPDVLGFTLGGLSKALALPQLKLGWMVLGGPDAAVQPALEALELIADTFLSVGSPVQAALPRLFPLRARIQQPILERLRRNRGRLGRALGPGSAGSALPVQGGWSAVVRVPATRSSEEWALALLQDESVLVHPGSFYDFPGEAYLVLSLLTPEPELVEGVTRLAAACARL
jgi:alanine-synthesizing transaminase